MQQCLFSHITHPVWLCESTFTPHAPLFLSVTSCSTRMAYLVALWRARHLGTTLYSKSPVQAIVSAPSVNACITATGWHLPSSTPHRDTGAPSKGDPEFQKGAENACFPVWDLGYSCEQHLLLVASQEENHLLHQTSPLPFQPSDPFQTPGLILCWKISLNGFPAAGYV